MTIHSSLTFLLAITLFAVTPGPGVFAILARALSFGALSCFGMVSGMILSDLVYLLLACYGMAAIATHWSEVFVVIRIVGAAYLFYLGWKIWTADVPKAEVANENEAQGMNGVRAAGGAQGFMQGFLISASNPKVILFYMAFLPTFMDLSVLDSVDIIVVSLLTVAGLMAGLMSIAFSAASARQFFRSPRAMKKLNRSAGGIMMGAGGFLALRQ